MPQQFWWNPCYSTSRLISRHLYTAFPANIWAPRSASREENGSFINSRISRMYFIFFLFQSKMIGNAAYDSLWYDFPAKESRTVLFLIVRSQKRLTITSGKIVDLSLERFTSVRLNLYLSLAFFCFFCKVRFKNIFHRLYYKYYFLKVFKNFLKFWLILKW